MSGRIPDDYPVRRRCRLPDYDYSQSGYYFITICTHHRMACLATVGNAVPGVPFRATPIGEAVVRAWAAMSRLDPNVKTDAFCLMPNHIHGIIVLQNQSPDVSEAERRGRRSLPDLVRGFKSVTAREWRRMAPAAGPLWQKSYYDEVIRNAFMLDDVRRYIANNPLHWQTDPLRK